MDDSSDSRRYSQEQIRALIQRASQLREERLGNSDQQLSLREIEHIAEELDIPADLIRSAALEMDQGAEIRKSNIFGAPFSVGRSRVFNASMSDEQWDDLVVEIRSLMGKRGNTEETGRMREWLHMTGEGDQGVNFTKTSVIVRAAADQTSVQMERRFAGTAIPAYAFTLFFATLISVFLIEGLDGLQLSTIANFAIFFTIVLSSLGIVRGTIASTKNRHAANFDKLMDRFAHTLHSENEAPGAREAGLTESNTSSSETHSLLDLDEEAIEERSSASEARRREGL